MTALKNRERILDVREERTGATPFEFREDAATGQVILRGYAATYEPYDCYGGPDAGGWVEQLSQASFKRTLEANPDVMLLLNHGGAPLARTKSGTMKLTADRRGLLVEARLDPSDPDVQALLPKMRRGDLDEMSFAFRVKDQEWDNSYTHRNITEVSLQKGDVSVVNYGMNPNTHVMIAETVGALAQLSHSELAELRQLDTDLIQRAISNLTRVAKPMKDDQEECGMDKEHPEPDADEMGGPSDGDADDETKKKRSEDGDEDDAEGDTDPDESEYEKEGGKPMRVDATIASALESSLLTAYSLAGSNPELQRKLKSARGQLNKLVGKEEVTDVDRRLLELRKEVGLPATSSVDDAFEYIRREGTDPATAMSLAWNEPKS